MNEARSLVLSYLGLRRAVGYIGIGLPFVLLFGKLLVQGGPLPGSISAYYYSDMRNVLVGALCAVAIFLISYRHDTPEARAGTCWGRHPSTSSTRCSGWSRSRSSPSGCPG